MRDITLETVLRRSPDVLSSPVENELVMMDIERGMYYSLNAVGIDIWDRLAEPMQVVDLCAQLQQVYAVDRAACEADVLAILSDMASSGLVLSSD